ncbi:MAG: FtsX-like permease family protein [Phycisphaerae bacterium]|nr:FtsX-like permease family protein [Phycisphaerae bacterium]
MFTLALKMLFGDRAKFLGILMGVTLASMVITQQGAIFIGLMARTFAQITDMGFPDVWVMDPKVQYIDDVKPMAETELGRVRGVEGVAWAMPLFKGQIRARLPDGQFQNCVVLGLDDATLVGGPPAMAEGRLSDLRRADAVIVDSIGANTRLARPPPPGGPPHAAPAPLRVGDTIELNDRRAVVVGISRNTRPFGSQPIIYTTYSRATRFAPRERRMLSFVLVKAAPGLAHAELCDRIESATGLMALRRDDFKWKTVGHYVTNTGIPVNFGIAVSLGFVIGTIITGFMFFSFTIDNLRFLGTLKAMGATDGRLMAMVVLQSLVVGALGFGLGTGLAALMGHFASRGPLAFKLPWQLLFVAGGAIAIICALSAMLSMHKVIRLEAAAVFKG